MATYYVDTASSGGDGTTQETSGEHAAWAAIAAVNAASFSAGDHIQLKCGCTFTGEQLVPPSSGSAGSPIVFESYGTGDPPIIDGAAAVNTAVNINAKNYITIQNILLKGGSNTGQGVVFIQGGAHHIIIQDNEIGPSNQHGVQFQYDAGGYNQILRNYVHNNAKNGISSYIHTGSTSEATRTIVSGNTVASNGYDGIHVRANYWTVEGNVVHDNGGAGVYVGIHVYSGNSGEGTGDNNIIRRNVVCNQKGNSNDGSGIGIDQWCASNQVYYNICYNNDGKGIYAYDAAGVVIENNTTYGNMQDSYTTHTLWTEIHLESSASDLTTATVKNNIAVATKANTYAIYVDSETSDNTLDITHNCWFAAATNWYFFNASGGNVLATWNALAAGIGTDLNADPLFVNAAGGDFRLTASSPCINAGTDVGLTTDFAGRPVPNVSVPDIGAYEWYPSGGVSSSSDITACTSIA